MQFLLLSFVTAALMFLGGYLAESGHPILGDFLVWCPPIFAGIAAITYLLGLSSSSGKS